MKFNFLFRVCRYYLNKINNDDNANMFTNGEYYWLKNEILNSEVVFDVGANVGDWTKLCLNLNKKIFVHCFEPSKFTFGLLKTKLINFENVVLNNIALGSINGLQLLHSMGDGFGTNSIYQRTGIDIEQKITEQINIVTLDQYCLSNNIAKIDILKIDVEGHELEVLNGARKLLSNGNIKSIQFEYGGTYIDAKILLKDIFELLIPLGYKIYKIYPNKLKNVKKYEQIYENFKYSNWVAIKNNLL